MKAIELRDKKVADLKKIILDLRKELFNLRFQASSAQLKQTARVRQVRRDIARIKTVIGEKFAAGTQN
ncbi:MAG: 50S ribosomal protein L29 [Alphaproteobacteria bacterium]|nr:50S ribosomal protein L29 [Alphaproteobacteria bacterium]